MLQFEGEREFAQSPEQLWPRLRDAAFLARCIPDGRAHDGASADRSLCTVHPGFSFMRGSLDITLEVTGQEAPTTLQYIARSKGIGSTSEVAASLLLTPSGEGTKVHWKAEVKNLGGLLKMVPHGLIRGAANKVIEDVWAGIAQKL
jgi:carbon monoxide dehydrogenase subunit G